MENKISNFCLQLMMERRILIQIRKCNEKEQALNSNKLPTPNGWAHDDTSYTYSLHMAHLGRSHKLIPLSFKLSIPIQNQYG